MNFDKIINNVIGKKQSSKGASIKNQMQWESFGTIKRNTLRKQFKDSDGDRVPDKWDCQPHNRYRQDTGKNSSYEIGLLIRVQRISDKYNVESLGRTPEETMSYYKGLSLEDAKLFHKSNALVEKYDWISGTNGTAQYKDASGKIIKIQY